MSSIEWLKCAQAGCLWCRFLAKRFLGRLRTSPQMPFETMHVRVGRQPNVGWEVEQFAVVMNRLGESFTLHTMEGNPAAKWIENRFLIPQVGKPYALALAKTCIEECVRGHPECQAITPYPMGRAPLPTRLIDCSDPHCLRIVETDPAMRGTYIALSYVWGDRAPAYRTTQSNLSRYTVKIDVVLPQTILDAINVTRALGVYLLWIDGLCIVQDSEKDMHHELARMRDVYRNAYVTIDASSAAKVSEGFLQDRKLLLMPYAILPFISPPSQSDGAQLGMVCVSQSGFRYSTSRDDEGSPDVNHTAFRGWCLQERLISTRLLAFTSQTLQLRCHTRTHNVGGAHHDGLCDAARLPEAVFYPHRHVACQSDEWADIHRGWWSVVRDYSLCKLSNPSDKLIAISAVAEMFAPTLGSGYIAGLWRHSLLYDLLWLSDDSQYPCSPRPTRYRGPSWSWASTDNPVSCWYRHKHVDWLAEVVKCTIALQNEQLPFGPVTGASLILRSPILPCKWFVDEDVDGIPTRRLSIELPFSSPFALEREEFRFDEDISLLEECEAWFVPLLIRDLSSSVELSGPVVTRAEIGVWRRAGAQGEGDVYRRIGMASRGIRLDMGPWSDTDNEQIELRRIRAMISQIPRVDIEFV
ncbi:heterokaryon incompatibility protein-domain-containing protein [Cubamyces menziesii]|nr:heterokaryon incompatibility protein-domain-containing protein [Cubamyces menziesii]